MKLTLIHYTGMGCHAWERGHAINQLLFTKATRLTMSPGLLDEIAAWPKPKKMAELEYMANTIPSSWEFVDYTFLVEKVTRAFTHQLVRTRHGSYAQQTMRVLDMSEGPGWTYETGPSIPQKPKDQEEHDKLSEADQWRSEYYHRAMESIANNYKWLISEGAKIEDARGILPTNIHTNIVVKFNLRTLVELVRKRSSPRVQGEYRAFLDAMQTAVLEVHPWVEIFIKRDADAAARDLDSEIAAILDQGVITPEVATRLHKLVDLMRKG